MDRGETHSPRIAADLAGGPALLLEREAELRTIADALERRSRGSGAGALIFEGPPGIGKTRLLAELEAAARSSGFRVLSARGSEMEREFGFGVVRQLLGPEVETDPDRLRIGSATLAASVFGFGEPGKLGTAPGEAPLYGLFRLVSSLAEEEPTVLLVDDAHWADDASLRFIHYLVRRTGTLPVLTAIASRTSEPGAGAEILGAVMDELSPPRVRPAPLTESATTTLVRSRFRGEDRPRLAAACHRATGGNPLLIEELLAELEEAGAGDDPDAVESIGPPRVARGLLSRARRLDFAAEELIRAVAVLREGSSLALAAALAGIEPGRAAPLADELASLSILGAGPGVRFAHPLFRSAVYEEIPAARREAAHSRAAALLHEGAANPEEVAAHLLLTSPGAEAAVAVADVLGDAAREAALRGAPESAAAYLRRALEEPMAAGARAAMLQQLASAEMALRDPAALEHLREAAGLADDPRLSVGITLQLADALALAGRWEELRVALERGLLRLAEAPEAPGALHLEAYRAAHRAYDPTQVEDFDRDLPRLTELVADRTDVESRHLRWVLAGVGSLRDMDGAEVAGLIGSDDGAPLIADGDGWESPLITQAALALLIVDADGKADALARALGEEGRERGALMAMVAGGGYEAAMAARASRLAASEAAVRAAAETVEENEIGLIALTTFLYYCVDTLLERDGLGDVAERILDLRLPPGFDRTLNGALMLDTQAAIRADRGDRRAAEAALRVAEPIFRALRFGPRAGAWRSRLALVLPGAERDEAEGLVREELELARSLGSRRAEGIALRAAGNLTHGRGAVELLEESVGALREAGADLELARSLGASGAALRRGGSRKEARERLREALNLSQRVGAQRLEARVTEELRVAGARPRRRDVSGSGSLTPAETRVASAAAAGASNREIAEELFVSLRTVEMHLTNAYRKLGISSRAELAGRLD